MSNCYAILTALGQSMVAESIRVGKVINLIEVAVGDADYTPNEGQAALMHERARVNITDILADESNPAYIRIMAILPPDLGGWHIHEAGVFDADGRLFAIAKLDGSYKPVYSDGMVKEIALDIVLEVSSEANVNIVIDPNLITVTRQWVIDYFGAKFTSLKDLFEKHIKDTNNPHKTKAGDVGAYTKEETDARIAALNVLVYPGAFHSFHELSPLDGWMVRNGAILPNADENYPELWAALKQTKNLWKTISESAWQEMSALAGGIGGSPRFVLDDSAKTIRLPDTRGDYEEGAGFDGLSVGDWHGDGIRNITGRFGVYSPVYGDGRLFTPGTYQAGGVDSDGAGNKWISMDVSRVVPTANKNQPRGFGMLPCVYVGKTKGE